MSNLESQYFIHRNTSPTDFYECEDLLVTSKVFTRDKKDEVSQVVGGVSQKFLPIPTLSYVIIAGTKLVTVGAGTFTMSFYCTSVGNITLYIRRGSTNAITQYNVAITPLTLATQSVSLVANDIYTIIFHKLNTSTNHSIFVNTYYTSTRLPRHIAYRSGEAPVLRTSSSTVVAVGDYKYSARTADFDGWLLCDGRAVYRDAYPALFEIIGTSFGNGNGSTTFNLPDGRGRVPGGVGAGAGLTSRTLGTSTGAETHTLTSTQIPSHTHTGTVDSSGSHTHSVTDPGHAHTQWTRQDDYNESGGDPPSFADDDGGNILTWTNINSATTGISIQSNGAHTHTFVIDSTGGGQAHNNMQPTVFIGHLFICAEI